VTERPLTHQPPALEAALVSLAIHALDHHATPMHQPLMPRAIVFEHAVYRLPSVHPLPVHPPVQKLPCVLFVSARKVPMPLRSHALPTPTRHTCINVLSLTHMLALMTS